MSSFSIGARDAAASSVHFVRMACLLSPLLPCLLLLSFFFFLSVPLSFSSFLFSFLSFLLSIIVPNVCGPQRQTFPICLRLWEVPLENFWHRDKGVDELV